MIMEAAGVTWESLHPDTVKFAAEKFDDDFGPSKMATPSQIQLKPGVRV